MFPRGALRDSIASSSWILEDKALFLCSISANFFTSKARAIAQDLRVRAYCLVLTNQLVELPVELKKFVRRNLALACKFVARSISGLSRAKARDAFAFLEILKVKRGRGVPPMDQSMETASLSEPSLFSTLSRKSSVLAN